MTMSSVSRETVDLKNLVRLVLPYPVSANRYWRSTAVHGHVQVYVSTEGKAYKRDVAWIAKAAGIRAPTERPIEIGRIVITPPATRVRRDRFLVEQVVKNGSRIDLDNGLKITFDALKEIVYVDDAQIERIRGPIEYGPFEGAGSLVIEIGEFVPPPAPLFAATEEAAAA